MAADEKIGEDKEMAAERIYVGSTGSRKKK